jgi:hypothetical protein|tara:strand:- start:760 stop:1119 length:360 start_codon:yes stop_codon:yes gene_type:complete
MSKKSKKFKDPKVFGQFPRTPPNDPHIRNVTYLADGTPFSSGAESRQEHDDFADGEYQMIKLKKAVNEANFVKLVKGDTPCLQNLLLFTKPLIKGNQKIKSCWRHLAKKCPDIDPFEDF